MCGICGELTFGDGAATSAETVIAMRERLVHRGPDDQGVFVSEGGRAALGFRRLRVIDLSQAANQPMPNEDGTVRVIFNGEIYNFRRLREGLAARGHRFRSGADTETIVHLYEERGADFVEDLDGMFAIAIWDQREGRLVLARDRAGKKPLFYYHDGERIVFGSEIKALLAHPGVPADIDAASLPAFFTFGYVPHPRTLYRGIRQVNPASVVVIGMDGRMSERRYWRLMYPDGSATPPASLNRTTARAAARERVRQLVTDAVSKRLISDVPLGAFLSGGIDSTIVVGVMSRLMNTPVRTFTIGFEGEPGYDETAEARSVAARFGTEHTEFRVRPSAVQLIDRLVWHHDGPFADSSAIPTYLVSELARPHVTVVLNGDGGDELFAGYVRFRAALSAERLPAASGAWLNAALRLLPAAPYERHLLARARRFARFMHLPLVERAVRWNSVFEDDVEGILDPGVIASAGVCDPLAAVRDDLDAIAHFSPLNQLLAANFGSYLPDDLLVKADRCTMANSLEARSPLLDTALTEYTASLPDSFKLHGGRTKVILRDAFSDLIPPEIARRPKTGFGVPLDRWFRGELRDFVRDTLLARSAASRPYLRRSVVESLVDEHQAGRANHGHRLWTLICFEQWLRLLPEWTSSSPRAHDVAPGPRLPNITGGGTMAAPFR
jgi:asparagine synthase (glutamine-hydrolysing)